LLDHDYISGLNIMSNIRHSAQIDFQLIKLRNLMAVAGAQAAFEIAGDYASSS